MIVWVDDEIFAPDKARDIDRLALLRAAALRRHTLIISDNPKDEHGVRNSPNFKKWYDNLHEGLRREVEMLLEGLSFVSANAVTRGASRLLVAIESSPEAHGCRVTLLQAIHAVSMPLQLLVEHVMHDAAFLRRVMPPVWRAQLEKWEERGLLAFENGGGNTVMKAIVEHSAKGAAVSAEIWRLQHFVVFDHDGEEKDIPGENAGRLKQACMEHGMEASCHMLERREMENYLPEEALREIPSRLNEGQTKGEEMSNRLREHTELPVEKRYFIKLTNAGFGFCKNAFFKYRTEFDWKDGWFETDGAWPEMTRLAESIAAAI